MDHEKWLEQHDQMMADHALTMASINEGLDKTEKTLRRAIRLAVQDARRQRKRNAEVAVEMAEIRQLHQEVLKVFLNRGGNGKP